MCQCLVGDVEGKGVSKLGALSTWLCAHYYSCGVVLTWLSYYVGCRWTSSILFQQPKKDWVALQAWWQWDQFTLEEEMVHC